MFDFSTFTWNHFLGYLIPTLLSYIGGFWHGKNQ